MQMRDPQHAAGMLTVCRSRSGGEGGSSCDEEKEGAGRRIGSEEGERRKAPSRTDLSAAPPRTDLTPSRRLVLILQHLVLSRTISCHCRSISYRSRSIWHQSRTISHGSRTIWTDIVAPHRTDLGTTSYRSRSTILNRPRTILYRPSITICTDLAAQSRTDLAAPSRTDLAVPSRADLIALSCTDLAASRMASRCHLVPTSQHAPISQHHLVPVSQHHLVPPSRTVLAAPLHGNGLCMVLVGAHTHGLSCLMCHRLATCMFQN